jgi:lipopolysaccharide/colanic/teichoic acid biosynthesis glycosyltransferase
LLTIAILIKRVDGSLVFYRGVRVGRFGKLFRIFKFRTMVVNAEKLGGPPTADDDPRITKMGKFIRKVKLDDPPQLINVFRGGSIGHSFPKMLGDFSENIGHDRNLQKELLK